MKKLYLVRHAKSSWKEEGTHDMDRPLKGRGIRDANNTSVWLMEEGYHAELLISSPATRAVHTALIFAKNLDCAYSDIRIEEKIYEASTKEILDIIQSLDDKFDSVMLFGHNPTITNFVNKRIDHRIDNVPTTGVACLKFDIKKWSEISNKAELLFFDYPKRRNI